jgi:hypothetical protein
MKRTSTFSSLSRANLPHLPNFINLFKISLHANLEMEFPQVTKARKTHYSPISLLLAETTHFNVEDKFWKFKMMALHARNSSWNSSLWKLGN